MVLFYASHSSVEIPCLSESLLSYSPSLFELLEYIYNSQILKSLLRNPSISEFIFIDFFPRVGDTFSFFLACFILFTLKTGHFDKYYPEILDSDFPAFLLAFLMGWFLFSCILPVFQSPSLPYVWLLMFLFSVFVF